MFFWSMAQSCESFLEIELEAANVCFLEYPAFQNKYWYLLLLYYWNQAFTIQWKHQESMKQEKWLLSLLVRFVHGKRECLWVEGANHRSHSGWLLPHQKKRVLLWPMDCALKKQTKPTTKPEDESDQPFQEHLENQNLQYQMYFLTWEFKG